VTTYLVRRLAQSLIVLLGVSFVVFFILHLTGDPAAVLLPPDASAEDLQRFRQAMGFDDPFFVQYGRFLRGALQGDFGQSIRHGEPAFGLVVERMPATFELSGAARNLPLLEKATRTGDRYRVQLPEAELYAALDALKAAGARILSVAQIKPTLEEYFMHLVEADRAQASAVEVSGK